VKRKHIDMIAPKAGDICTTFVYPNVIQPTWVEIDSEAVMRVSVSLVQYLVYTD
jgi:hypothetical protein